MTKDWLFPFVRLEAIVSVLSVISDFPINDVFTGQWKFSGDKHKSLQVDTERTFHQRYPLVML